MFEQLIKLAKVQGMLANITQLPHASDVDELQGMVRRAASLTPLTFLPPATVSPPLPLSDLSRLIGA